MPDTALGEVFIHLLSQSSCRVGAIFPMRKQGSEGVYLMLDWEKVREEGLVGHRLQRVSFGL